MEEEQPVPQTCPLCGRRHDGEGSDPEGTCSDCRKRLIRRSATVAWVPALLLGAGYVWLLFWSGLVSSMFLIVWIAFGAVLVYITYKVAHRAAFDVIRARAHRGARG
jgi:fatty acid desaturase